jgi:predicted nucleotidyltransferase
VEDALTKADLVKPETPTPGRVKRLSELQRVERQLTLAQLALNKYERKLENSIDLDCEEERLFLAHQDSIRKLEMSLSALRNKNNPEAKSDLDIAIQMVEKGLDQEDVVRLFGHNDKLKRELEDHFNE